MFTGEYQHALDPKGRVILPARFRHDLEQGAYMAKGQDGCIAVYPADEWEGVAERARELSRQGPTQRNAARAFFAGAAPAEPDRQGRVAIPQNLREFAGLDRDVVVAGVFTRVEIWSAERWTEVSRAADSTLATSDEIAGLGL